MSDHDWRGASDTGRPLQQWFSAQRWPFGLYSPTIFCVEGSGYALYLRGFGIRSGTGSCWKREEEREQSQLQ